MDTILKPGDIFLSRGTSIISRLIRFFSRSIGEKRTKVNHVGVVVQEGTLKTAIIVEAVSKVKRRTLWEAYGPPAEDEVVIYRPKTLTEQEIRIIVATAERQVGKQYGYGKIIAHLLDWILLGAYVFRRLTDSGDYPICSWLVAHAFAEAGKNFGVEPGAASPDDIWDFIQARPDLYECIYPLSKLQITYIPLAFPPDLRNRN